MGIFSLEGSDFTPYVESIPVPSALMVGSGEEIAGLAALGLSGNLLRPVLGALDTGDPDELAAQSSAGVGDPQPGAGLGAIEFNAARRAPASALLDVGATAAQDAPLGVLEISTTRGQWGALGALGIFGTLRHTNAGALDWTLEQVLAAQAGLTVAVPAVYVNLGALAAAIVEKTAAAAALEIQATDGFALSVDILDAIVSAGRGDAAC